MSVLIKGMKKPKWCEECRFYDAPYCAALGIGIEDMYGPYLPHAYCPLIEVPTPHGRLIDGDKLTGEQYKDGHIMVVEMDAIEDAPTVIEAED